MTNHDRAAWLEARRTGIGGSDVAAILGLSKWRTPMDVYLDKLGEGIETPDNPAMRWGRALEPAIRQVYADETGRDVRVLSDMLRDRARPWMLANLDGFAEDSAGQRVVEIKTARTSDGWGEPGSGEVPQPYLLQVQHYMIVTGWHVADIAALIGGSDFRIYTVESDRELQEMIVDAEAEFWDRVTRRQPPEPLTVADAVARWGRSSIADVVMADDQAMAAVEQLRDLRHRRERIERAEEDAKAILMRLLGERDTLVGPDGKALATWKASKPAERFDAAAFRAAHPALAAEFTRLGEPSRRFLVK